MSKDEKKKQAVDPFFAVVARVYGVPETGIDAIGSQPYLNKDGRLYLLKQLRKDKANKVKAIRVEFIKTSMSLTEPAIVKKTIVFADGLEVEAIGEASKDSVGSESVKQTLNMVAETRALNRVIWQAIGGEIMEQVQNNLENMEISDEDKARIVEAGRVSYEEMQRPTPANEVNDKEAKLYEATVKRLDEISQDEKALRRALENLNDWPLEAAHKAIIEERIYIALSKIRKPESTGKAGKKKKKTRKPVKKSKESKKV
jgi:hypothetical protein